jgi:H+/Cl- antiporter ClcA
MTLLSIEIMRRRINLSWGAIIRSIWSSFVVTILTALPAVAVLVFLGPLESDKLWTISFLAGIGGVAAWAGSLFLVRHPLRQEIISLQSWVYGKLERVIN